MTPGGNYLGVRKSRAGLRRFKRAAHSIMAAARMAKLVKGASLAPGASVATMALAAKAAERAQAKREAAAKAEEEEAARRSSAVSDADNSDGSGGDDGEYVGDEDNGDVPDEYEDECAQCGVVAFGSQDDQTGDFYCTCLLRGWRAVCERTSLTHGEPGLL